MQAYADHTYFIFNRFLKNHSSLSFDLKNEGVSYSPSSSNVEIVIPSPEFSSKSILITDFETEPNYLGGNITVYGAGDLRDKASDELISSDYTTEEKHSGKKSYRLVFGRKIFAEEDDNVQYDCFTPGVERTDRLEPFNKSRRIEWVVLSLNLGEIIDDSSVPVKIAPLNVSRYRYLVFWVKGKKGGEKFKVGFRDAHANTYDPQVKVKPKVRVRPEWRQVVIDLQDVESKVDLTKLVQISIAYGRDNGNRPGSVFYVDDFELTK